MPAQPNKALTQVLKKIKLFDDLSPSQIQRILAICTNTTYNTNDLICAKGSAGDEIYFLLSGRVAVKKPDGTLVTTLKPIATIGEMSIIAPQQRVVTVEAVEPSGILTIKKQHLDVLMKKDPQMPRQIYKNMITMLSNRFLRENVRLCDFKQQKLRIIELEKKLGIAAELLAKNGMTVAQAGMAIDAKYDEAKPKIMIVDDEPPIRAVVKKVLTAFNVLEAENGKAAMKLAAETTPDLVIADINMPEMDGFQLLNSLREKYPDLPVVGLSGYVSPDDAEQFGFDAFFVKPLSFALLEEQIRARLEPVEKAANGNSGS